MIRTGLEYEQVVTVGKSDLSALTVMVKTNHARTIPHALRATHKSKKRAACGLVTSGTFRLLRQKTMNVKRAVPQKR